MYSNNGTDVLEPIELYLTNCIDVDRLTMYRDAIDTIKKQAKYSIIDSVNSIIPNVEDEAPSDVEQLIYASLCNHIRDMLLEYEIITRGGSLPFLTKLVSIVNMLDEYEESQALIDLATNDEIHTNYRLYNIFCAVEYLDEEEWISTVSLVSHSFLEQLIKIHQTKLDNAEMNRDIELAISTEAIDLSLLKVVAHQNPGLMLNNLLKDNRITTILPTPMITALVKEYHEPGSLTGAQLAKELLAIYMVSGLVGEPLINLVKEELPYIEPNDIIVSQCTPIIGKVYQELTC